MIESLQEHVLCRIPKVVHIPYDPYQSPEDTPRVPAHQFLEHIDFPILDPRHECSIGILRRSSIGDGTGLAGKRIQIFWREYTLRGEIRCRPETHLECIQEVGEGCHHHSLQDPLFAKPLTAEEVNILEPEFGGPDGELKREIQ